MPSNPTSQKSYLILSSHQFLGLPSSLLSGFPTKTLYKRLLSPLPPRILLHALPPQSSWFDHPNNIWWGVERRKLLVKHFSHRYNKNHVRIQSAATCIRSRYFSIHVSSTAACQLSQYKSLLLLGKNSLNFTIYLRQARNNPLNNAENSCKKPLDVAMTLWSCVMKWRKNESETDSIEKSD